MASIFSSLIDQQLIKLIENGAIGVIPTDTVYGLVCQASKPKITEKLVAFKGRKYKPGTIIAADIDQLIELGFKARYLKAVEHLWPGPISIVIPSSDPATAHLRYGHDSIPVRIPKDTGLISLLKKTGPLLTTSANLPNQPPATNLQAAKKYFDDKIDFYVDGGDLKNRQASTIVRVVDDEIEVLRDGAVKIKDNKVVT